LSREEESLIHSLQARIGRWALAILLTVVSAAFAAGGAWNSLNQRVAHVEGDVAENERTLGVAMEDRITVIDRLARIEGSLEEIKRAVSR